MRHVCAYSSGKLFTRERILAVVIVASLHAALGAAWSMQPRDLARHVQEMEIVMLAAPVEELRAVPPQRNEPVPVVHGAQPPPEPVVEKQPVQPEQEDPLPEPPQAQPVVETTPQPLREAPAPVVKPAPNPIVTTAPAPVVAQPVTKPAEPVTPAVASVAAAAPAPVPPPPEVEEVEPDYKASYLNNRLNYPFAARRMGMQGRVVLEVEVLVEGVSGQITVAQSSGHDMLDRAALESVKTWRFVPARRGGQPYTKWFKVPVQFKLKDQT